MGWPAVPIWATIWLWRLPTAMRAVQFLPAGPERLGPVRRRPRRAAGAEDREAHSQCRSVPRGAVTRHGTVIQPPMTSLVGYPGADAVQGGWCGNDVWREVLTPAQTCTRRGDRQKVGDVLGREGLPPWLLLRVDLLRDLDSGELYFGEVNPASAA